MPTSLAYIKASLAVQQGRLDIKLFIGAASQDSHKTFPSSVQQDKIPIY
jgi:hypothetical protein